MGTPGAKGTATEAIFDFRIDTTHTREHTHGHTHMEAVDQRNKAGWTTCDFTFLSTVFQSYQDDGWMIMNSSVQWNRFRVERFPPEAEIEPGTARSVGQRLNC